MSAAGLVQVSGLLARQMPAQAVLLLHYSSDHHLYLFLFRPLHSKGESTE
jgi:hypothetical protein